tara:strand:+ start:1284 stop:3467 length:2184 start_codon:yes stop_codon:yes gene_type:complete
MATENELAQEMERLRNAVQGAEEAVENTTTGFKAAGKAFKDGSVEYTKTMGNFTKSLGQGNTNFTQLNTVVDVASNALQAMAKAIPFAGEALSAGVKATGEASKFVIDQLQQTSKAFNDLGQVGALTAQGMTGLQQQFIKSGMSMDGFKKVVTDNASTLARFGGIVGQGADQFTKAVGAIVDSDAGTELRKLGFSADQIGQTAAGFLKQQTLLGKQNQLTQEQVTKGSIAYARELDELSKLTGMNKDQIQQQQDSALNETRFLASQMIMEQEGRGKAAKAIRDFQTQVSSLGPGFGAGIRDLASGNASTAESQKVLLATNGEAAAIMERLKNGQIDQIEAQKQLQASLKANEQSLIAHGQAAGDSVGAYPKLAESVAIANAQFDANGNVVKKLEDTQKGQLNNTDKLTDATIKAQINLEQMSRQIANLGFSLMPSAAVAIQGFTTSLNQLLGYIAEVTGVQIPGIQKQNAKAAPTSGLMGAASGAGTLGTAGALAGSFLGPVGAGVGAAIGATVGGVAGYYGMMNFPGGASAGERKPEDLLMFGGGTGSRQHFDQLDQNLREKVLAAADQYYQMTGKKLQINSAYRSAEEQAAVNSGNNPKAAPGNSRHQSGLAVDIQNYMDPAALQALKAQGLYQRVPNDPVHFEMAYGGIVSGPKSGYQGMLHGDEAVIPLAGGRNVPVEMPAFTGSLQEQIGLLSDNNSLLSELIGLMGNNNSISSKILQASRG